MGIRCPVAEFHPATCGRQPPPRSTTRFLFRPRPRRPFNCYERDIWTEVAKHLCGFDLLRLSATCRWFHRLLADDSIWRYACFRDLSLSDASPRVHCPLYRSWRSIYFAAFDGSHAFSSCQSDDHYAGSRRIGSFVMDSPDMVLIGRKEPLPLPKWHPSGPEVAMMCACKLLNARPGIWIAGNKQILEARHCELFLKEASSDDTLECETLGEHLHDEEVAAAFCAVVNAKQFASPSTAGVLNTSWAGKCDDLRHCASATAAAIHTNLRSNRGLRSTFEAMRDKGRGGQIVSVRISQVHLPEVV